MYDISGDGDAAFLGHEGWFENEPALRIEVADQCELTNHSGVSTEQLMWAPFALRMVSFG